MYRSKAEYDIAVKEAQTPGRTLSVKVKQFDISHARIHQHPLTKKIINQIRYPGQPTWHYFIIERTIGLPIKISAESAEKLQPVYEGIVSYLEKEAKREIERDMSESTSYWNTGKSY
jgi:hypothetical protein